MNGWKMIEQAREELQKLETHYPKRFDSLKLELRSFISLLESNRCDHLCHNDDSVSLPPASTATTQASTCRKRKKTGLREQNKKVVVESKDGLEDNDMIIMKKKRRGGNRVEAVLQNALLCLRKIRELKSSLC